MAINLDPEALPIQLYDRSRVVTDWGCERKRFWQYEWRKLGDTGAKGIVPDNTPLELYLGIAVHDGLAAIAAFQQKGEQVDIDLIATTAQKQVFDALIADSKNEEADQNFANEQAAMVEGMLRGFYKHVWPALLREWPIIKAVEQEMVYPHNKLTFMARPDLVLSDGEGTNVYIEYKTTSSKRDQWISSWNTAVQLHSTIAAIEHHLRESVEYVVVQGLYKGYEAYGKQSSPFCYAYHRAGNPPFSKPEWSYIYKPGTRKFPVWQMDGGVKAWVDHMPDDLLTEQFPRTPPISINRRLVEDFFAQRTVREKEIALAMQMIEGMPEASGEIMATAFQQKFEACNPGWGKGCSYRNLCFGHVEDPLEQGYEYRTAHHDLETTLLAEE